MLSCPASALMVTTRATANQSESDTVSVNNDSTSRGNSLTRPKKRVEYIVEDQGCEHDEQMASESEEELECDSVVYDDESEDSDVSSEGDVTAQPRTILRRKGRQFLMCQGDEYVMLGGELIIDDDDAEAVELWPYFGRDDVGHIKMVSEDKFEVRYDGDDENEKELCSYTERQMSTLFGMQITRFLKDKHCEGLTSCLLYTSPSPRDA